MTKRIPRRECTGCLDLKPLGAFSPDARRPSGRRSLCKACQALHRAAWRKRQEDKGDQGGPLRAPRGLFVDDPIALARYYATMDARAQALAAEEGRLQEWEASCLMCGDIRALYRVPSERPLVTGLGDQRCQRCGGATELTLVWGPVRV